MALYLNSVKFLNKFDYDLNHNYNRLNILVFKGSKIYIKFKVFYEKYLTKDLLKGRKKIIEDFKLR